MKESSPHILFIDDDETSTGALIRSLQRKEKSFNFSHSLNPTEALKKINSTHPEVAIVDLTLDEKKGPESGLELIGEIIEADSSIRILVLTGHETEEYGIKALHRGAASFIQKPADSDHLIALIRDSVSFSKLKRDFLNLDKEQQNISDQIGVSTKSPSMEKTLKNAAFAASNSRPILLVGQTGTGKGVLSQAIHDSHQRNCKTKGLFIRFQPSFDELPHDVQVLLLNVLQEKKFRKLGSTKELSSNFRLIAATNRPLESLVEENKLRRDFYHRIAHAVIELPPLNQRLEDIADLSLHFVNQLKIKEDIAVQGIKEDALNLLTRYNWPGNIRELQSIVEGAAYMAAFKEKHFVDASDINIPGAGSQTPITDNQNSFRARVKEFELNLVIDALKQCDDNQSQAATLLKIDRSSLRRILKRKDKAS